MIKQNDKKVQHSSDKKVNFCTTRNNHSKSELEKYLQEIPLQQTALNMSLLYKPGLYEKIVAGLVKGKSLSWDATIPQSLTHYLDGVDLASRTVQQGQSKKCF